VLLALEHVQGYSRLLERILCTLCNEQKIQQNYKDVTITLSSMDTV